MGKGTDLGSRAVIELVKLARVFRAILLPPSCRFVPTCSEYALETLESQGARRAFAPIVRRLLRCHPWHPGGLDPAK